MLKYNENLFVVNRLTEKLLVLFCGNDYLISSDYLLLP